MKNQTLIKIERILLLIVFIGLLLRLFKIEFAGIILVVSMSSLSVLYFIQTILCFRQWKQSRAITIINALLYFFLAGLISGILFLIMFWIGGQVIIYQSFKIYFFIIACGLIYAIIKGRQSGIALWTGVKTAFIKYSIALFIGVIISLLPNDILIKAFTKDPQLIRDRLENHYQ